MPKAAYSRCKVAPSLTRSREQYQAAFSRFLKMLEACGSGWVLQFESRHRYRRRRAFDSRPSRHGEEHFNTLGRVPQLRQDRRRFSAEQELNRLSQPAPRSYHMRGPKGSGIPVSRLLQRRGAVNRQHFLYPKVLQIPRARALPSNPLSTPGVISRKQIQKPKRPAPGQQRPETLRYNTYHPAILSIS